MQNPQKPLNTKRHTHMNAQILTHIRAHTHALARMYKFFPFTYFYINIRTSYLPSYMFNTLFSLILSIFFLLDIYIYIYI